MEIHGWNRGFHRICIYKWIDWIDFQLATFDHWRVPIGDLPRWRRWYVTNDDVQIWISYSDNTLPNKPNEFWENRINKTSFDINSTDTWSVVDFFRCVLEFGSQDSTISRLVAHVFLFQAILRKLILNLGWLASLMYKLELLSWDGWVEMKIAKSLRGTTLPTISLEDDSLGASQTKHGSPKPQLFLWHQFMSLDTHGVGMRRCKWFHRSRQCSWKLKAAPQRQR